MTAAYESSRSADDEGDQAPVDRGRRSSTGQRGRSAASRHAAALLRHYVPVLVVMAALAVLIALAPTVEPSSGANNLAVPNGPLIPADDTPGTPGLTVSGVHCAPGVRQVPWSSYAPICQPVWHGDNGGATAPGVSAKTITITYRYALPPEYQTLEAMLGPSVIGTEAEAEATMQAYVSLFNRSFELYGRKVVLHVFTGKGNLIQELAGGGQVDATADAATAQGLGAFADLSLVFSTSPYDAALAQDGIVAISSPAQYQSAEWFAEHAPYVYSTGPDCDTLGRAAAAVMGSLTGLPAIAAKDPVLRSEKRVFALIAPSNPMYQACATAFNEDLAAAHVDIRRFIQYSINLTGAAELAANAIAQLQTSGVTTVICACDPITPVFLAAQAKSSGYFPEWAGIDWGDPFAQAVDPAEWADAVTFGIPTQPVDQQEAYRALELAHANPAAMNPLYSSIYEPMLMLFDALQAAGPDLTPATFRRGFDSLPGASDGEFGAWHVGTGAYQPSANYHILIWNTQVDSSQDGKPGAWVACNANASYAYANPSAGLEGTKQLACPGVTAPSG